MSIPNHAIAVTDHNRRRVVCQIPTLGHLGCAIHVNHPRHQRTIRASTAASRRLARIIIIPSVHSPRERAIEQEPFLFIRSALEPLKQRLVRRLKLSLLTRGVAAR
jgi:hypothetical protein